MRLMNRPIRRVAAVAAIAAVAATGCNTYDDAATINAVVSQVSGMASPGCSTTADLETSGIRLWKCAWSYSVVVAPYPNPEAAAGTVYRGSTKVNVAVRFEKPGERCKATVKDNRGVRPTYACVLGTGWSPPAA